MVPMRIGLSSSSKPNARLAMGVRVKMRPPSVILTSKPLRSLFFSLGHLSHIWHMEKKIIIVGNNWWELEGSLWDCDEEKKRKSVV